MSIPRSPLHAAAMLAAAALLALPASATGTASATQVTVQSDSRWRPSSSDSLRRSTTVKTYAVESALTSRAVRVHRAARASWPQITTYYGYRNDPQSDHYYGRALDLMIPSYSTTTGKTLGGKVAAWAVQHHRALGVEYVIWDQHIWNVSRASEGWRLMADRGSDSANHKNHVHISVLKAG